MPRSNQPLTGQFGHNNGVKDNSDCWDKFETLGGNNLPAWLQSLGYRTGLFGKYLNGYHQPAGIYPAEWSNFEAVSGGLHYFDYNKNIVGNITHNGTADSDYMTDWFGNRAATWIRNNATNPAPFFLLYTPYGPHTEKAGSPWYPIPAPRHESSFAPEYVQPPPFQATNSRQRKPTRFGSVGSAP